MALDMGQPFPTDFEGVPPHISSEDFQLWERWRRRFAKQYKWFFFDVAIGEGAAIPPGTPENVGRAWQRLTRLRLDLLADRGDEWHLIEFRPHAGPGAIGALQSYHTLILGQLPDDRPIVAIAVTDGCSQDIKAVAGLSGMRLICLDEIEGV